MLTKKQIQERLSGVGSSDAPAVLGLSPYKTADQVLQEKLGLASTFEGNERTDWGNRLEPIIRKEVQKRMGIPVIKPTVMERHPDHPFLIAHLDGYAIRPDACGVIEIKNMRFAPKDPKEHMYYAQLMHQLAVMGCQWGALAILIGGNELKIYEYPRDEEFISALIKIEGEFWSRVEAERNVQSKDRIHHAVLPEAS